MPDPLTAPIFTATPAEPDGAVLTRTVESLLRSCTLNHEQSELLSERITVVWDVLSTYERRIEALERALHQALAS